MGSQSHNNPLSGPIHFNIINPEAIDLSLKRSCPCLAALLKQCLCRALRRDNWLLKLVHSQRSARLADESHLDTAAENRLDFAAGARIGVGDGGHR